MLLGASNVQVCTAAMHYGFRIVEHFISGLQSWMQGRGFERLSDFVGHSVPAIGEWAELDLGYKVVAEIDQKKCIHCGLCYIACEDGAHQSIDISRLGEDEYADQLTAAGIGSGRGDGHDSAVQISGGKRVMAGAGDGYVNIYTIRQETCVGCNLCSLVCPVDECIAMVPAESEIPSMTWREYQDRLGRGEIEPIQPPSHV
jgi:dihydropyrimidine dehydrogenase (NAD+) subunit PreA